MRPNYEWEVTADIHDVAPSIMSSWLLALITAPPRRNMQTRASVPLVLHEGERNDRLFRLACGARRFGLSPQVIREHVESINRHHCQPPLDADELVRIAASAARYDPTDTASPNTETTSERADGGVGDGVDQPLFVRACDLSAPPITWLVRGLIADRMLHVLSGKDKRGKTLLALEIGRAVLRREPLLGHFATRSGPVMAALLDDPLALTLERLDRLGVRSTADEFYVVDPTRTTDPAAVLSHLAREAPSIQPALVILDALYLFLPEGREAGNDAARMRPLMVRLNRLVDETGATVLVVAHDNKSGTDVAGSYVIRAMAKAILRLAIPAERSDETAPDEPTTTRRVLALESKLVAAVTHVLDLRGVGDWALLGEPKSVRADELRATVWGRLRDGLTGTADDIARAVGKRRVDVDTVLAALVREELIHEDPQRTGSRGPLARVYKVGKPRPEPPIWRRRSGRIFGAARH
jgi:hypothetical protein